MSLLKRKPWIFVLIAVLICMAAAASIAVAVAIKGKLDNATQTQTKTKPRKSKKQRVSKSSLRRQTPVAFENNWSGPGTEVKKTETATTPSRTQLSLAIAGGLAASFSFATLNNNNPFGYDLQDASGTSLLVAGQQITSGLAYVSIDPMRINSWLANATVYVVSTMPDNSKESIAFQLPDIGVLFTLLTINSDDSVVFSQPASPYFFRFQNLSSNSLTMQTTNDITVVLGQPVPAGVTMWTYIAESVFVRDGVWVSGSSVNVMTSDLSQVLATVVLPSTPWNTIIATSDGNYSFTWQTYTAPSAPQWPSFPQLPPVSPTPISGPDQEKQQGGGWSSQPFNWDINIGGSFPAAQQTLTAFCCNASGCGVAPNAQPALCSGLVDDGQTGPSQAFDRTLWNANLNCQAIDSSMSAVINPNTGCTFNVELEVGGVNQLVPMNYLSGSSAGGDSYINTPIAFPASLFFYSATNFAKNVYTLVFRDADTFSNYAKENATVNGLNVINDTTGSPMLWMVQFAETAVNQGAANPLFEWGPFDFFGPSTVCSAINLAVQFIFGLVIDFIVDHIENELFVSYEANDLNPCDKGSACNGVVSNNIGQIWNVTTPFAYNSYFALSQNVAWGQYFSTSTNPFPEWTYGQAITLVSGWVSEGRQYAIIENPDGPFTYSAPTVFRPLVYYDMTPRASFDLDTLQQQSSQFASPFTFTNATSSSFIYYATPILDIMTGMPSDPRFVVANIALQDVDPLLYSMISDGGDYAQYWNTGSVSPGQTLTAGLSTGPDNYQWILFYGSETSSRCAAYYAANADSTMTFMASGIKWVCAGTPNSGFLATDWKGLSPGSIPTSSPTNSCASSSDCVALNASGGGQCGLWDSESTLGDGYQCCPSGQIIECDDVNYQSAFFCGGQPAGNVCNTCDLACASKSCNSNGLCD
jgi:hypothetical protein